MHVVEADTSAPTGRRAAPWGVLFVMGAGAFMDLLDGTIVQVALPSMQRNLQLTEADLQWTSTSYTLAFALALITSVRLGEMFGRKRTFLSGLVAFTGASFLVAVSADAGMLIGFRVVQGLSAALMLPQILTFVQVEFTGTAKPKAYATYGMLLAVASASGPVLGGLLIQADIAGWGWRTIFLVNVPIGIAAFVTGLHIIPESKPDARGRLDPVGLVLIAAALLAVFYPLIQGRYLGWPVWSFIMLACAVPLLFAFFLVQARGTRMHRSPLIDLGIFANRASGIGLLIALLFFGTTAYFFVLTLHLQLGLGFSALSTGITFLPFSIGTIAGSMLASPMAAKLGRGAVAIASGILIVSLIGMDLVVREQGIHLIGWALAGPQGGTGLAFGIASGSLVTIVLARVASDRAASASGVVNTVTQLGSVTAIAIVGAIFFSALGNHPGVLDFVQAASDGILYLLAAAVACLVLTAALPREAATATTWRRWRCTRPGERSSEG